MQTVRMCVCVCESVCVFDVCVSVCVSLLSLSLSRSLALRLMSVFLCFCVCVCMCVSLSLSLSLSYIRGKRKRWLEYFSQATSKDEEKARKNEDESEGLTFNHVLRCLVLVLCVLWALLVLRDGINFCHFIKGKI